MHFDDDNLYEWLKYSENSYSDRFQLCLGHTVGGKAGGQLSNSAIGGCEGLEEATGQAPGQP